MGTTARFQSNHTIDVSLVKILGADELYAARMTLTIVRTYDSRAPWTIRCCSIVVHGFHRGDIWSAFRHGRVWSYNRAPHLLESENLNHQLAIHIRAVQCLYAFSDYLVLIN